MNHFRTTFFKAVGDAKRVRIYRVTLQRVGSWMPIFKVKREFYCTARFEDAQIKVDSLNGGPLPASIVYADSD